MPRLEGLRCSRGRPSSPVRAAAGLLGVGASREEVGQRFTVQPSEPLQIDGVNPSLAELTLGHVGLLPAQRLSYLDLSKTSSRSSVSETPQEKLVS